MQLLLVLYSFSINAAANLLGHICSANLAQLFFRARIMIVWWPRSHDRLEEGVVRLANNCSLQFHYISRGSRGAPGGTVHHRQSQTLSCQAKAVLETLGRVEKRVAMSMYAHSKCTRLCMVISDQPTSPCDYVHANKSLMAAEGAKVGAATFELMWPHALGACHKAALASHSVSHTIHYAERCCAHCSFLGGCLPHLVGNFDSTR